MRIEINSFSAMSYYVWTVAVAPRITDNNFEADAVGFLHGGHLCRKPENLEIIGKFERFNVR